MATVFLGQYLLEEGLITAEQLLDVLSYQNAENLKIGDYAIQRGFLVQGDVDRIVTLQKKHDLRFGKAAIELQLLTRIQLNDLLDAQKSYRVSFGEAVELLGFASRQTILQALDMFRKQKRATPSTVVIPSGVGRPDLVCRLFDLTHKMLLRLWGIQNKPDHVVVVKKKIVLPDLSVRIHLSGDITTQYFFGVATTVAAQGVSAFLGKSGNPEDRDECQDLCGELANIVCGNVVAELSEAGLNVEISSPQQIAQGTQLGDLMAVQMPLHTPFGASMVGATYEQSTP